MLNKRKKKALTILVVIIVIAVAVTYILPIAILSASADDVPEADPSAAEQTQENPEDEEFGTDDPALLPPPPEPPKPPATIEITTYPSTMEVGDQGQLQCLLQNAPEGVFAEWSSNNPNVAVVDPTGSIAAIAPGDAEVTVRAGDLRASALIHVNDYKASKITILVADRTGEQDARGRLIYKIEVGDVCHLTPRIDPKGAKLESIAWTVSDPDVAELSGDGDFVANAKGQTSVTASSGTLSDTIYFDVEESGIPIKTLLRYILIGVIILVAIVVVVVLCTQTAKRRKEEDRKRAAAAKRRREEARKRDEEAAKRAADEAELAAKIERTKQIIEMETSTHRPAKVSGATVSATGDAAKSEGETTERPLTLDDIE
jgi:flagellar basal body-associated protein FliL